MAVINRIAEFHEEIKGWRRDLHAHPETAFEELRTSDFVAEKLAEFGIEVHRGLATTGVVGVLDGQSNKSGRAIGLRADMDALHIHELNDFDHRSTNEGKMHACGHDGHTAMLLGAAKYLAETRNFDGRITFIFQPAEENEGGGRVMVEEGLFDKFPVEAVYGLHNMPGREAGTVGLRAGPAMASFDIFEIVITGKGAHAAMPHLGVDPVVTGAQMVTTLQTIVSRRSDPIDPVVLSVTQFHAGDTWNVIPETAVIRGTVRAFRKESQDQIEEDIARIAEAVCTAQGATMTLRYERRYPALVNSDAETDIAAAVAAKVVGQENVEIGAEQLMGSEDFAYMLQEKPGCYIWLGNGTEGGPGGCSVHNPHYDFNDEVAVVGASYWATLAESTLPKAG
ncbi:amidohydrolase [Pelagibius litoralis]|uniref:Amidohydrolase n=1 Tax=Pelagibius litoralis TaxID=374515 RepID=A0A967EZA0_9PROT|nr:M20 aminoacylase family protein [Pelagibius litoralis]NIA70161.1 amidohydrolase [Pelagibius litoralis]